MLTQFELDKIKAISEQLRCSIDKETGKMAFEKVCREETGILMMIDLDYFKNVNDTFGHAAGDEALKHFSEVLRKSAEGKSASVGRWGGEEFVIFLRNMSEDKAASFAEKLRKNVEDASFGVVGRLTCSIGLSHLKKEDTFDNIFRRIDRAMYASKNAGRNRVTKE